MKKKLLYILLYPFILLDWLLGADSSTQEVAEKWRR